MTSTDPVHIVAARLHCTTAEAARIVYVLDDDAAAVNQLTDDDLRQLLEDTR